MSLELRLERFQRLIVPDLWWQPVPCQWCRHGKTTSSKIRCSWDDDEVAVCGRSQSASGTEWQMTQVDRSLLATVVQDHVKPCRLANMSCVRSLASCLSSSKTVLLHTEHARQLAFWNEDIPLSFHDSYHGSQQSRSEPGWLQNLRRNAAVATRDKGSWRWWTEVAYAVWRVAWRKASSMMQQMRYA